MSKIKVEKQNKTIIVLFKNNIRKDKRIFVTLIAHDWEKAEDKVFSEDSNVLMRES